MNILLSNDDGYFATGLGVLHQSLLSLGKLEVVAPERDRSGASNSLTLDRPLRLSPDEAASLLVGPAPYYVFFSVFELAATVSIVVLALRWTHDES